MEERASRKSPRGQERRKCPLRPLSSFEVHERLSRTERRRSGYSLPFLLSRGVLPFPSGGAVPETAATAGHFAITIVVSCTRRLATVKRSGGPAAASSGRPAVGKTVPRISPGPLPPPLRPGLFVPLLRAASEGTAKRRRRRRTIGDLAAVSRPGALFRPSSPTARYGARASPLRLLSSSSLVAAASFVLVVLTTIFPPDGSPVGRLVRSRRDRRTLVPCGHPRRALPRAEGDIYYARNLQI